MDTTKRYIELCKEADINNLWDPKPGDFYQHYYTLFGDLLPECDSEEVQILTRKSSGGWIHATNQSGEERLIKNEELHTKTCVWLPRLDQLLNLLYADIPPSLIFKYIDSYENLSLLPTDDILLTVEQRVLACLMLTVCNKKLIDGKWVGV